MTSTCSNTTAAAEAAAASSPYVVYPSLEEEERAAAQEPLLGYPVIPTTVDGQPVYAYLTPAPRRRRRWRCVHLCARASACITIILFIVSAGCAAFFVWPRSIDASVEDISLHDVHFNIKKKSSIIPQVFVSITLDLVLKARNPNYFSFTYDHVSMEILYEGDEIGEMQSEGGTLDALSTSDVDAVLELDSYEIASNVVSLVSDVAKGAVPLQTTTVFDGYIDVYSFQLPVVGKVTCNLVVSSKNQTLLSQNCNM